MTGIYNINEAVGWDALVRTFANYDVYYLSGYVKTFRIHGDGDPQLFYYEADGLRGIYVYMKRKTTIEGVYDSITPYGYGGFLLEGDTSEENLCKLWNAYTDKMNEENIVDDFVRYHPVLKNADAMRSVSDVIDMGRTIAIDTTSSDIIWSNLHIFNRNRIRKATKNGIVIRHGKFDEALIDTYMLIYGQTMDKNRAGNYYYFKREFYESIATDLKDNYELFWAELSSQDGGQTPGKIISMSIIIYANERMHYHLGGTLIEYRNLAANNLLFYKAALWGCEHGMKTFHLGGGLGSCEDGLYRFKSRFNRLSDFQFCVAKNIFNQEKYDQLVEMCAQEHPEFDRASKFFPL